MFKKKHKYGVSPKAERTVDGIVFASKKESIRYGELKLLQQQGLITGLKLQPNYECVVNGKKICGYVADFLYETPEGSVVEDVKGFKTRIYRLKKKLVEAFFRIKITET